MDKNSRKIDLIKSEKVKKIKDSQRVNYYFGAFRALVITCWNCHQFFRVLWERSGIRWKILAANLSSFYSPEILDSVATFRTVLAHCEC